MNNNPTKIRLRQPGKLAKTTYANEIAAAVNSLDAPFALGACRPAAAPGFGFVGKIVDTGPNGEDEGNIEVYWVQIQYIVAASAFDSPTEIHDDKTLDDDEFIGSIVPVTNLAERVPLDGGVLDHGLHALPLGMPILVRAEVDEVGAVRYVTYAEAKTVVAALTYSTGADGTTSTAAVYKYTGRHYGTNFDINGGDEMAVLSQRPLGKLKKATIGIVTRSELGAWVVLSCDEVSDFAVKTVVTAVTCNGDGSITVDTDQILSPT